MRLTQIVLALLVLNIANVDAAVFMDSDWAQAACAKWNDNAVLTTELGGHAFAENDAGRGYKVIQFYREHCGERSRQQLTIASRDGKAICTHGGAPTLQRLNYRVDYLIHATDGHWACIGKNEFGCGLMGAMMSGRLKLRGPKYEVMNVVGPFENMLRMMGALAGDNGQCPASR